MVNTNGTTKGMWRNGYKHGYCRIVCKNGDIYENNYNDGYTHGDRILIKPDGSGLKFVFDKTEKKSEVEVKKDDVSKAVAELRKKYNAYSI
jgi:hypothetical protein